MEKGVLPIPEEDQWKLFILILREIAREKKLSTYDIATRMGIAQPNVQRIFSLKYTPGLPVFLKLCRAIEVNLFIESKDSDSDFNQLFEKAMEELGRRPDKLPKN